MFQKHLISHTQRGTGREGLHLKATVDGVADRHCLVYVCVHLEVVNVPP